MVSRYGDLEVAHKNKLRAYLLIVYSPDIIAQPLNLFQQDGHCQLHRCSKIINV